MKKIIKKIYFYYKKLRLKKMNSIVESNVSLHGAIFSTYNRICKNSQINNSSFGRFSYVGWNTILNNVEVGAFSSIGPFTEVIYGTHPIDFVSTHPVFYSTRKQCGTSFVDEQKYQEFKYVEGSNKSVIIGNDVWIGYGVKIIEGVTIHDGAVILAGAIVTKDVKAYSVVGGIPAKHIKYRFDLEEIKMLKKFKWWEQDIDWIKNNSNIFLNIDSFKNFYQKYKHVHNIVESKE